ncbi:MAG: guanine deaminase [Betaproteobacteria bacterium]|nr:guanine deaminase [Betaproteobacteria bacterium]
MKAIRASLLWFSGQGTMVRANLEDDGLLIIGTSDPNPGREVILAAGPYQTTLKKWNFDHPDALINGHIENLKGRILAPGFIDLHVHYPQLDVIGSPASGLLTWLNQYTFKQEQRFADPTHSAEVASLFLDELERHGVTTALTFATAHTASVNALFEAAQGRHMRLITGLCLMDQHAPGGLCNDTEQSLVDSELLIQRWHGVDRLGYAISPRFVPSCSAAQLKGAGLLAAQYPDVWIQSHVAENMDEIAWVKRLYPEERSYLSVYDHFGLLRERSLYAHCLHLDAPDFELLRHRHTAAAICPTSNLFLGSGFFDYQAAEQHGFLYGLASDVGGGTSLSPFATMLAAFYIAQNAPPHQRAAYSTKPQHLWWQHTAGAAQALGLEGVVGNLMPGCDADVLVLNPQASPLLARRTAQAQNLDELLFALIVLGDDRLIERTLLAKTTRGDP